VVRCQPADGGSAPSSRPPHKRDSRFATPSARTMWLPTRVPILTRAPRVPGPAAGSRVRSATLWHRGGCGPPGYKPRAFGSGCSVTYGHHAHLPSHPRSSRSRTRARPAQARRGVGQVCRPGHAGPHPGPVTHLRITSTSISAAAPRCNRTSVAPGRLRTAAPGGAMTLYAVFVPSAQGGPAAVQPEARSQGQTALGRPSTPSRRLISWAGALTDGLFADVSVQPHRCHIVAAERCRAWRCYDRYIPFAP